jgi:transcriptional regulator with XRE-family HTH domain
VENFADELRAWRERLGWSQAELGAGMGYSGSHVSSVETMSRTATYEFAKKADEALGTPGTFVRSHKRITKEAFPSWFTPFVDFEARAARIHNWDQRCLTGLLQTEDYARAILRAAPGAGSADDIEQQVALWMERQTVLDGTAPPELCLVLSEGALRVQVGGPEVMRAQLGKLAEVADRGQVTLQVLPAGAAAQVHPVSSFTMLDFADPVDRPVVYTEHLTGGLLLDDPDEVRTYSVVFDRLRAAALGAGQSIGLIASLTAGSG